VEDDGSLGFKFWLRLAGIVVLCGIAALILFLLLSKAVYAWGFLGGFLAFALLLLAVGWVWDKRSERKWDTE
jgi:DMSO/TMAO reductase YedYZ heme-binding membrane subunit